jgi:hypothetical protein
MLFINNQKVSTKEFIEAFGLEETLGLPENFESFRIDPTKPVVMEFTEETKVPDRLGFNGKFTASRRTIPREYRASLPDGENVEIRYSTMLPRADRKTGAMEYPVERKKTWLFERIFTQGAEEEFLFMLVNPECKTSPCAAENPYYKMQNKQAEIQQMSLREDKLDECHAYIRTLSGQALVIKALGAKVENAYQIYNNEGESALRLTLRSLATRNPFHFMELMTKEGGEVTGRIKYAVGKGIIQKAGTGVPGVDVWQFADGQEITKTTGSADANVALTDTIVYSQDMYQKLCRMVDKELTPEALTQLKNKSADVSDKINTLIDSELITYDPKLKSVFWVLKGEIVEEPVFVVDKKSKNSWKVDFVEAIEKDKSLKDMINDKYKTIKKVSV